MPERSPLLTFLRERILPPDQDGEEFSLLFAEARSCGLLGRLVHELNALPVENPRIKDQCEAATIYSAGFRRDVWRELSHIEKALSDLKTRVILLKGASYVLLGLPAAEGRKFSDIDILVAKDHVASAEASLMLGGWSTGKLDAYDQRYYREWSHEIPPMTHLRRGTTIDLHHSLAMPTCRLRVDSVKMVSEAIPVAGHEFWWRLKDEDIVLHAASHLLLNSEFDHGLRDLWDIDLLYRHFIATTKEFPERLLSRAQAVGLEDIVRQALKLASRFLGTPVPGFLLPGKNSLVSRLLEQAASTRHPETRPALQGLADTLLLTRELYLRLPTHLLAVHLWHKATTLLTPTERPSG